MSAQPTRREFVLTGLAAAVALASPASAQPRDLTTLTLRQASDLVRRKRVSAVELTEACLTRIDRYDRAINTFITMTREEALTAARNLDGELRRGTASYCGGRLDGYQHALVSVRPGGTPRVRRRHPVRDLADTALARSALRHFASR